MSATTNWHYVGTATSGRMAALASPRPAAELPVVLREGLALVCYHRDPGHTDTSYERAVFCGTVEPSIFDWFFNASTGYRGAYYEAADAGLRFNRALINCVAPTLVRWVIAQDSAENGDWIVKSLCAPSAKAWLAEYPGLCSACEGEWSQSQTSELRIENGRWEQATHTHAIWGRQAPLLTKIRIFGGLINAHGQEWLAAHKEGRATHISQHGWN